MEPYKVDVIVIGAGLSGISFARYYLDVHPACRLVILEKDSCIGGVWSARRGFDAFWAQSPLRMTSFSDVTLSIPKSAPRKWDTFEARYVTQYLEEYLDNHVYDGRTLRDRVWLDAEVHSVTKTDSRWTVQVHRAAPHTFRSAKLVVASGLTSIPIMPSIPQVQELKAPIWHHRDFGMHEKSTLAPSSAHKQITVLGGGKSAADMVWASVTAGKIVNWVIRRSGEGPGIFMNPATTGRYRNNAEAGATQKATTLSPSGFRPMCSSALELHQSVAERSNLESKLYAADQRYKKWANYKGREGALPGFRDLEPTASFFWSSGPVGMIQQPDFWPLVSQKVNVYRADIVGTTANSLTLDDGRTVPTDVLLCGTGWNANYAFFSPQLARELGLPHDPGEELPEEAESWGKLMKADDQDIIKQYPFLAKPPANSKPISSTHLTPARLYNGIASLTDPSIVFLGRARLSNNFRGSEAQAIWATAYWDGHIKLPPFDQAQREVAYMNAFSRRRYPSRGFDGLNFHADLVWYTDRLVSQAGLESHRKGWWEDPEEPCLASDFRDCKDEYLAKYGPR